MNGYGIILILGAFGALVGSIFGYLSAKKNEEMAVPILLSPVVAGILPLVFWFVWTTIDAIQTHGFSFGRALGNGLFVVLMLSLSVPWITGFTAIISVVITYRLTRNVEMENQDSKQPR